MTQPTLKSGARGPAVVDLLQALRAAGFEPGPATASSGTARSPRRSDGIVGARTWGDYRRQRMVPVRQRNGLVSASLSQPQFDALVSFVFNVGAGNFEKSTLLRRLNAGAYSAVPSELLTWNKAGGGVLEGSLADGRPKASSSPQVNTGNWRPSRI